MIIGISGKKQSGKDTVGLIIQLIKTFPDISNEDIINKYILPKEGITGSKWQIKKFAKPLKEIISIITGCAVEDLEDEVNKNQTVMTSYYVEEDGQKISENFANFEDVLPLFEKYKFLNKEVQIATLDITPRYLLEQIGTNVARQINPDIWVNTLMNHYKSKINSNHPVDDLDWEPRYVYPNWIITDVRFLNEVKAIKDREGIIIRLEKTRKTWRKGKDGKYYKGKKPASPDDHISETALDSYPDFDYTIVNNSSLDNLINKVRKVLNKIDNG